MSTTTSPVNKRCEWNRYCSFEGPFYPDHDHIIEIGHGVPRLVGRCYACGTYVCNRCAHRRHPQHLTEQQIVDAWELLCPFDGELLGKGNDWMILHYGASSFERCTGAPTAEVLYRAFADENTLLGGASEFATARGMIAEALTSYNGRQYGAASDACLQAIKLLPYYTSAWVIRLCASEKLHRLDAAWEAMQKLLYFKEEALAYSIGEISRLCALFKLSPDEYVQILLRLLKAAKMRRLLYEWWARMVVMAESGEKADEDSTEPKMSQEDRKTREMLLSDVASLALAFPPQLPASVTVSFPEALASDSSVDEPVRMNAEALRILGNPNPGIALAPLPGIPTAQPQPAVSSRLPGIHTQARSLINTLYGNIVMEICPPDAQRTLVLLCHEYSQVSQQKNIYLQLEHILEQEPYIPVLLEGFSGLGSGSTTFIESRPQRRTAALRRIEREGRLASDVLSQLYPEQGRIRGVDDPALLERQQQQRRDILDIVGKVDTPPNMGIEMDLTFFYGLIANFMKQVFNPAIMQVVTAYTEFLENQELIHFFRTIMPIIEEASIELEHFPNIHLFMQAIKIEDNLDYQQIEGERSTLLQVFQQRSHNPLDAKTEQCIQQWLDAASPDESSFVSQFPELWRVALPRPHSWLERLWPFKSTRNAPPSYNTDSIWLQRLLSLALALKVHIITDSYYYERLVSLADCLGIEISRAFRNYFDYVKLARHIDAAVLANDELPRLPDTLTQQLVSSAPQYAVYTFKDILDDNQGNRI